jgi:tetratricopeptide (TPR) repeat protein
MLRSQATADLGEEVAIMNLRDGHMEYCKLTILFLICLFLITSCSTRPYRMKRAERLYRQGQLYHQKGQLDKAIQKLEESLSLAEMIGFEAGVAHNLNEIALVHLTKRECSRSREMFSESLAIYEKLNMGPEISKTLNNIASTYLGERNFKGAIKKYEELIEWDKKQNNDLGVALSLYNIGVIYQNHLKQHQEAQKYYSEALKLFKKLGKEKYIRLLEQNIITD